MSLFARLGDKDQDGMSSWGDEVEEEKAREAQGRVNGGSKDPSAGEGWGVDDLSSHVEDLSAKDNLIESTYDVAVTLADQQGDPDSPLYSIKTFEDLGLHQDLLKGIYQMKFQKPSKIQERALPLLLTNPPRNLIGQSQSGTGKTAAFVLNMLSRIDVTLPTTQAICLAPVRELARQIMDVVQVMGKFTKVTTAFAIRESVERGQKLNAHVVVGTPGTVTDLITKKRALDAKNVKVFVLDEADNMLSQQGLGDQSIRVKNLMPKNCQIVLFSATFPDAVRDFAVKFAPNANEIKLKHEELSVDGIKQFYMDCESEEHKYQVLVELYSLLTIGQSMIFTRTRASAEKIAKKMTAEGHSVAYLHGALDAKERDEVMDSFRTGVHKVLITTNVISRGIDVLQVNMVVNYDIPVDQNGRPDPETYLHRIGRTGRFGRQGISINMVHDRKSWQEMDTIEKALGRPIIKVETRDFELMEKALKAALK